ncbi:dTDP-4-dehydrorhamnose reductase [Sphingorhabdus sp.]|uniref:dTDP-4-dehydrorhamnose reductase n=1 Tax=Sphingorhabdus sp. TaxID=1902408 RepID=UPI0035AE4090
MKTLIFGGDGQVGRALSRCAPKGIQLHVQTRATCDISDASAISSVIQVVSPNLIVNAAAYTAVDKAETDGAAAHLINAIAPGYIAKAAQDVGARFIHLSTDFVFDGKQSRPYRPQDTTAPLSVYGKSKLDGELAVSSNHADSLIVRTGWVYAAEGKNFVRTMLSLMRTQKQVSVVSDQIGTPTHSASLAKAIWDLAATDLTGVCHFTDSGVASWYDLAVAIAEESISIGLLDRKVEVLPIDTDQFPTPARRPPYSVLDKSLAWEAIGKPSSHWRVNLRTALRDYKKNV